MSRFEVEFLWGSSSGWARATLWSQGFQSAGEWGWLLAAEVHFGAGGFWRSTARCTSTCTGSAQCLAGGDDGGWGALARVSGNYG